MSQDARASGERTMTLGMDSTQSGAGWCLFPHENSPIRGLLESAHYHDDTHVWLVPRLMTPLGITPGLEQSLAVLDGQIDHCTTRSRSRSMGSCGLTAYTPTRSMVRRLTLEDSEVGRGRNVSSGYGYFDGNNDDSLMVDSSLLKCHIRQLDSHIGNTNELLNELESSIALDPHLRAILKVTQRENACLNLTEQETLLIEWLRNRRNLHKRLYSESSKKFEANVTKPTSKAKSRKAKCISPSVKSKVHKSTKKLTLTKPSYIKQYSDQHRLPIKPIPPFIIPKPTQNSNQNSHTKQHKGSVSPRNTAPLKPRKKHNIILGASYYGAQFRAHPIEPPNGDPSNPEMIFPCSQCPKSFTQKSQWRRHVECVHLNLVKYFCDFCGKGFKRSDHLKNHSRRMHNEE